jgi:2-polyprenyl-3-methyl-5-hydroxy-6-metoxy-1,4-benzoquinol methylase
MRARPQRSAANYTRKNTRRAYDRVYRADDLRDQYLEPKRLAFYDEIAEICARLSPTRVVDIGCGTGNLLASVVAHAPTIERVVGLDHAAAGIAHLRRLLPEAEGIVGNLYNVDLGDGGYDLVLCTEVLEHLREPEAALTVLCRLCASGGTVLVTVPDGEVDSFEGHENFWGEAAFSRMVSRYGDARVTRMGETGLVLLALIRPAGTGELSPSMEMEG